jgi:CheY-like chemotaxis protein
MARVLVVEDDPGLLVVLHDALEIAGHEVTTANDGAEALRLYRADPPDVIVTDLLMPRRSGFELVSAVRRTDPRAAIIAISGVRGQFLAAGKAAGVSRVFAKPFDTKDVVAAVAALAAQRLGSDGGGASLR